MRSPKFLANLLTRKRALPYYALLIILPLLVFLTLLYRNVNMEVESVLTFSARQSIEQSGAFVSKAFQDAVHVSDAVLMNPLLGSALALNLAAQRRCRSDEGLPGLGRDATRVFRLQRHLSDLFLCIRCGSLYQQR